MLLIATSLVAACRIASTNSCPSGDRSASSPRRNGVPSVTPTGFDRSAAASATAGARIRSISRSGVTSAPSYRAIAPFCSHRPVCGLAREQIARRHDHALLYAAARAIDDEIDARERASSRIGLGDRNPAHFVRDARVRVTGEDGVDHARGQTCGQFEDLGPALARREVARGIEAGTAPAGMGRDDNDGRTRGPEPGRLSASITGAIGSSRSPCVFAAIVCRNPPVVITPMIATLTPAASIRMDGRTFGHATGRPVAVSARLAARNGNDASEARAFSAPRASTLEVAGVASGPDWPEIELVIAHGGGGVPERVVSGNDRRAFAEI